VKGRRENEGMKKRRMKGVTWRLGEWKMKK
jgi:hypothetical protein